MSIEPKYGILSTEQRAGFDALLKDMPIYEPKISFPGGSPMKLNKQALKPGKHTILFRDNWDGEGDVYETLATLGDDLIWYDHENGKSLIEYEGDEVLKVWPLDDGGNVLALLDELEAAERQNGYLREQRDEWERKAISNFEECSEMAARIDDLESQRQLAFTASNRWADKFREAEQRNAEQAAIIAKQEKWIKDVEVTMIAATDRAEAAEKRIAELSASHQNLREAMAGIHNTITGGGAYTPLASILNASKRAYEESAAAAGITVKGDSE